MLDDDEAAQYHRVLIDGPDAIDKLRSWRRREELSDWWMVVNTVKDIIDKGITDEGIGRDLCLLGDRALDKILNALPHLRTAPLPRPQPPRLRIVK